MSIYANDQNIRKTTINIIKEFGVDGLIERIKELEARLEALESKPKVGRPRKVVNG